MSTQRPQHTEEHRSLTGATVQTIGSGLAGGVLGAARADLYGKGKKLLGPKKPPDAKG